MKIGFAKIGRAWEPRVTKASTVGGDVDVIRSLGRMIAAHPDATVVSLGKTRADPRTVFPTVEAPWYDGRLTALRSFRGSLEEHTAYMQPFIDDLDAAVIWLGQIGGAATAIPKIDGSGPITPLQMDENYAAYLVAFTNGFRARGREPLWLSPDPRNRFSLHDFYAPPGRPIAAQYNASRNGVFYDPRGNGAADPWLRVPYAYAYAGVEFTAIPDPDTWPAFAPEGRKDGGVGIIANENRRDTKLGRGSLMLEWFGSLLDECSVYGKWSADGLRDLGFAADVPTLPYHRLYETIATWKATMTFPASGSGWATAKPWEMFAAGVVCFFHPAYDDQGHIVALTPGAARSPAEEFLAAWLRPKDPADFRARLQTVIADDTLRRRIVHAQRVHAHELFTYWRGGTRVIDHYLETE